MIELAAAITGAVITAGAMRFLSSADHNRHDQALVVRLTVAVENIGTRLEELHKDIKIEQRETYGRFNSMEQRITKLETLQ